MGSVGDGVCLTVGAMNRSMWLTDCVHSFHQYHSLDDYDHKVMVIVIIYLMIMIIRDSDRDYFRD